MSAVSIDGAKPKVVHNNQYPNAHLRVNGERSRSLRKDKRENMESTSSPEHFPRGPSSGWVRAVNTGGCRFNRGKHRDHPIDTNHGEYRSTHCPEKYGCPSNRWGYGSAFRGAECDRASSCVC